MELSVYTTVILVLERKLGTASYPRYVMVRNRSLVPLRMGPYCINNFQGRQP